MQDVHNNNSSAKNNEIMMDNLTDNNNLEVNKSDEEENGLPNLIQFNTQMKQVFFGSTGMKIRLNNNSLLTSIFKLLLISF